jgi:hypothetical protein
MAGLMDLATKAMQNDNSSGFAMEKPRLRASQFAAPPRQQFASTTQSGFADPSVYPPVVNRIDPRFKPRPKPEEQGPSGGGSLDTRPPQQPMPWERWRDQLLKSRWYNQGDSPPQHMLNVLSQRPALLRAIENTPELMKIFRPFMVEQGPPIEPPQVF